MKNQTPTQPTPEQIAKCAYLIWEKEGWPDGRQEAHWLQAEKQLTADCAQDAGLLRRLTQAVLAVPTRDLPIQPKRRHNSKRQEALL